MWMIRIRGSIRTVCVNWARREVYADADLGDIRAYVVMLALYVLSYDVTLRDGETIGFSEEQKLTIKLSEGIAIEGDTLKVEYDKDWMKG